MGYIRVKIESVVDAGAGFLMRITGRGRPGEQLKNRELMQQYGFTSRPKAGAEGIAQVKGSSVILIATDDRRYRIGLEDGEVAIYTDEGDKVHFKRDREIEIIAGTKLTITTPTLQLNGDLKTTGKVDAEGNITGLEIKNILGTTLGAHTHPYVNVATPAVTSVPIPGA